MAICANALPANARAATTIVAMDEKRSERMTILLIRTSLLFRGGVVGGRRMAAFDIRRDGSDIGVGQILDDGRHDLGAIVVAPALAVAEIFELLRHIVAILARQLRVLRGRIAATVGTGAGHGRRQVPRLRTAR